jgi:4-oxalocrotonate tautomerase
MPFVKVGFTKPALSPGDLALPLSERITGAIDDLLAEDHEPTVIQFNRADSFFWSVNGKEVSEDMANIAAVEVFISKGAVDPKQIESLISKIYEILGSVLSPLHEESYVLVHELTDKSWGYGGKSLDRHGDAGG